MIKVLRYYCATFAADAAMNKYFFIHINRTGGMSIQEVLGIRGKEGHCTVHDAKFRRHYAAGCFVFTFVRNPWDEVLSQYRFRRPMENGIPVAFNRWVRLMNSPGW